MKRFFALFLAILTCMSLLSGCAREDGDADSVDDAVAGKNQGGITVAVPESTKWKEHLVIGLDRNITTVDPHTTANNTHNALYYVGFDRLLYWNSSTQQIEAELAKTWEWKDNTTLHMTLRDDVTFHNGEKFTSDDVKYSFEHAIAKASTAATNAKSIKDVKILGDYECEIILNEPNMDFLMTLSLPMMSMVNREACEKDDNLGGYIGTGPRKFKSMVDGDEVTFEVNDKYWGEIPKAKTLTFKNIPEASTRLIAVQNGDIDACVNPNVTEIHIAKADENLQVIEYAGTGMHFFAFNNQSGAGADQNFRLALAHALDIEELALVGADGKAKLASTYWGWTTFGYDESIQRYEFDLDKAKEYLSKTEYRSIEITCIGDYKRIAENIQAQAKKNLGVEITLNEVQSAAQTAMTRYNVAEHQALVYGLNWNDMGDDARRPYYKDSNTNKGVINDQEVMDWIDAARQEADEQKRKEYYSKVQKKAHEQCWVLPLYYSNKYVVLPKQSGGCRLEPNNNHDFSFFCVAAK